MPVVEEHPSPTELLEYHERALEPAVAERVLDHLVDCEECSAVVLDFAAFPNVAPRRDGHRLSGVDVEERWRRLDRAISDRSRPFWQRHEVLLPVAAIFFAGAVGLGLWGARLRSELEASRLSRGAVEVVADLSPAREVLRGGRQIVSPSPGARRLVFVLLDPGGGDDGVCEADLLGDGGRPVATGVPVFRGRFGDLTVELPRSLVPPGSYRLELHVLGKRTRARLADYRFTIVEESSPRASAPDRPEPR